MPVPARGRSRVSYCFWVSLEPEGETERAWRRYQRGLFDGVARLGGHPEVGLTMEARITMARVRGTVCGG
jgi:hypothetical protein